jgi:hypothetical protein
VVILTCYWDRESGLISCIENNVQTCNACSVTMAQSLAGVPSTSSFLQWDMFYCYGHVVLIEP